METTIDIPIPGLTRRDQITVTCSGALAHAGNELAMTWSNVETSTEVYGARVHLRNFGGTSVNPGREDFSRSARNSR